MCPDCGGEYGHLPSCPVAARNRAFDEGRKLADLQAAIRQQPANDAILEAEAWKQTASRWRKRALQEGRGLRQKLRKAEEEWVGWQERAEIAEAKLEELEFEKDAIAKPLQKEINDLQKAMHAEKFNSLTQMNELADIKRRMGNAGSLEALVVERDSLKDQVADLKKRLDAAEQRANASWNRAHQLQQEILSNKERIVAEMVNPAKARIRVLATRLGVTPMFDGYSDDDKLTAELDRRIFELTKVR
jgi:chromosome segregation ATPase